MFHHFNLGKVYWFERSFTNQEEDSKPNQYLERRKMFRPTYNAVKYAEAIMVRKEGNEIECKK